MPDAEGKRKRKRKAKRKAGEAADGDVPAAPPPPERPPEHPPEKPPSHRQKRRKLHPINSGANRAFVASAAQLDPHALHVVAYARCDPAAIAACPECQRTARSQAQLQAIKVRTLARAGAGTRVAALRRGGGSGVTPPVAGGGTHSAVAWRLVRRRPRPSLLGPAREADAGREKQREEREDRMRERVREKVREARREARGRGEVMWRAIAKLVAEDRRAAASTHAESRANAERDDSASRGPVTAEAGPSTPTRADSPFDIDNLPPLEIDPALEAMDAAGALDLLEPEEMDGARALDLPSPEAMDVDSAARVSGELDEHDEQEANDPNAEEAADDETRDAEETSDAAEPEPEGIAEDLDAAVERDFAAAAAARAKAAKAKGKGRAPPPDEDAEVAITTSDRTRLAWESRWRDARLAEGVAAYLAQKHRAHARGPVSILKKPNAPKNSSRNVAFHPTVRVYRPRGPDYDYPHPELYGAVAGYAQHFYGIEGRDRGRRDTKWEVARRWEMEAGGVWGAEELAAAKKKGKKEKVDGTERGPYVTRDMEGAFDGTALLHLCESGRGGLTAAILIEEYLAYQMRGAGWRPRGKPGRVEPREKPQEKERDPRAPQRVYYEDVEEGTARAEAVVHAMRKVRFRDSAAGGTVKAKEPTPEIPTIVLDDSSDEEQGTQAAPVRVDSDED